MTTEARNQIILSLITRKIRITFEEPNSPKSISVSKGLAAETGISHLEIHRFHNAVLNSSLEISFKQERVTEIAPILLKQAMRTDKFPNEKIRGQLSAFANDLGFSFNDVLEVIRDLYKEIIDQLLQPQSKA